MTEEATAPEKTREELRQFGLVLGTAFTILGGVLLWKERPAAPYCLIIGSTVAFLGILVPTILRPVEKIWMKFAEVIARVMTPVIVAFTFFCVITPIAVAMRACGKRFLQLRPDPDLETYWIPVEPDGPHSRPYLPY